MRVERSTDRSESWVLAHGGRRLFDLERADTFVTRTRGLLGRESLDGALLITKTKSVHTLGMKFPIDVAFCDSNLVVVRLQTMQPHRVSRVVFSASCVVELPAGSLAALKITVGDQLEIMSATTGFLADG